MEEKVKFETVNALRMDFGNNKFIEVARRIAKGKSGSNEFLQISRGFYLPDGQRRYKKGSISIPDSAEIKKFISEKILEI